MHCKLLLCPMVACCSSAAAAQMAPRCNRKCFGAVATLPPLLKSQLPGVTCRFAHVSLPLTHPLFASVLDLPARELFAAAAVDGLVLLHGGHCTDALLQTVTALDALTLEVVFTEDAPEARVAHAAVSIGGGSVMMYGGTNMLHPPAHDDCLMFDAGSKQW